MPIERETVVERPACSDTIVVGGGNSFGIIGGIIAAVIAVILVLWLVNGGVSTNSSYVNMDIPDVTVTD